MDGYWRHYPPPSRPLDIVGGIKAGRGGFGSSWWAKRWLSVLEGLYVGGRLSRGRTYARRGQVISLHVEFGRIEAEVQGSRAKPYRVHVELTEFSKAQWNRIAKLLAQQAAYAAQLLAGEMPTEIDDLTSQAGLSLFPRDIDDLQTDCSCPDWSNPCKHIAAVHYLVAQAFDRDPFLLFTLRGKGRAALTDLLVGGDSGAEEPNSPAEPSHQPVPLLSDPQAFWNGRRTPSDLTAASLAKPTAVPLLKQVGEVPFWRGTTQLADSLKDAYETGAETGLVWIEQIAGVEPQAAVASSKRNPSRRRGDPSPKPGRTADVKVSTRRSQSAANRKAMHEPVTGLDLSTRARNALRRAGIGTVGELQAYLDRYDPAELRGVGEKTAAEIRAAAESASRHK